MNHLVRKTTDPVSAPTEAGIHWINTVTNVEWFSVGTASVADWIPREAMPADFTDLNDVPASYVGQSGKIVRVKATEDGLEFAVGGGGGSGQVLVSSNDSTLKYLEDAIVVSHGTNASTVLAKTTLNDGADEDVQIQFDISKVDLSLANNTTSDFASEAYADAKVADSITNGVTTIAPSQNAVFDALALQQTDIDDLVTLSGVAANSTTLGTFTGTTIPDNQTNKQAFQALETGLEDHIADPTDAHDAAAISVSVIANLTAVNAQDAFAEHQDDIDDLVTLSGVAANAVNLGTFTGTTIPDNQTNKQAFQALETAVEGKEPTITVLPIAKGGTNSGTALSNNRVIQSSAGAIVEAAAITAARALISDANGIPTHSTTTDTELGYVSGVTSSIQTQLNGKSASFSTSSGLAALLSDETGTGLAVFNTQPTLSYPVCEAISIVGNIDNGSAFTSAGTRIMTAAFASVNDSVSPAATVITQAAVDGLEAMTLTATNAITVTNLIGMSARLPIAGSNVTVTNPIYAVGAESIAVGTAAVANLSFTVAGTATKGAFFSSQNANNSPGGLIFNRSSATLTQSPELNFSKSKGTTASKTVVSTNDVMGRINFLGYDGTDYGYGARIQGVVTETTPGSAAMGSKLEFYTSPVGSETPTLSLTIASDDTATFTGTAVIPRLVFSGNVSSPAWTTSGIQVRENGQTFTDTSSSGTVATAYTSVRDGATIAASSATTFTNYIGNYFVNPVAGTNVTMTNRYAIGSDGPINLFGQVADYTSVTPNYLTITASHTYDFANIVMPSAIHFGGTHTLKQTAFVFASGFLFNVTPTVKNQNGVIANLASFYMVNGQPTFQADGAAISHFSQTEFVSQPTWNRINAGTINCSGHTAYLSTATVGAGCTIVTDIGYQKNNTANSGVLTNQVGFNTASFTSGTNNTHVLIGTTTPPAGNFGIYQEQALVNRWAGGHRDPTRTDATATITITSADYAVNATSTAVTATSIPSAVLNPGLRLRYKKSGTGVNAHTLTSAAGNFDTTGALTLAVTVQNTVVEFQSDGTNWIVFKNSVL